MKWIQLAVITFIAIQQTFCQIEGEYQLPLIKVVEVKLDEEKEARLPPDYGLESDHNHRHFSTLYNVGKHPKKLMKVIKIKDENNNEFNLIKRQEKSLTKRSKKKAALLIGGGAAIGALAMKHFSKPSGGGSAAPNDPNAGV